MKICFKNKSFIIFEIISFSITYIQTALMMGLSYYFEAFSINFLWCYLAMFAGIVTGMVLFTKSAGSWGIKKSIVFMCLVFGGGMFVLLLLGQFLFAGVNSFICKPAISLANTLFPAMLLWFGYDAEIAIANQTELAKFGIRFSWLIVPVVLLFICAVSIHKLYPLHGEQWQEIKEKLSNIHEEKQRAYEQEMLSKKQQ